MFVTELTSHEPIGWLKAVAVCNILFILVTELTFQEPIG